MDLTLSDRIKLQGLLPRKGDFKQLIILEDIQKKIKITQEEVVKYNITSHENQITWKDGQEVFPIVFTDLEKAEVVSAIRELDKSKQLTAELISICKVFDYNG